MPTVRTVIKVAAILMLGAVVVQTSTAVGVAALYLLLEAVRVE